MRDMKPGSQASHPFSSLVLVMRAVEGRGWFMRLTFPCMEGVLRLPRSTYMYRMLRVQGHIGTYQICVRPRAHKM